MRVLVTGGAGFLGKPVVRQFRAAGHEVFVPRSGEYDLRDPERVRWALLDSRPEVVIHLAAAVGGIGANVAHPGRFLYENALMGLQLMEQSRLAGVEKFVTIGTTCEYPAIAAYPLREGSIWSGYPAKETAPYGIAKRLILAQGQAYREEYAFNAIHLLPTNLYGPGDNFDAETSHVIPALIRRFSEAVRENRSMVELWGSGDATREFLFVEDAAEAIVLATDLYDSPAPVNIGTGVETSIRSVAEMIAQIYGLTAQLRWNETKPAGVDRRWLDTSRAQAFGFRASTPLSEGLKTTIEWYES